VLAGVVRITFLQAATAVILKNTEYRHLKYRDVGLGASVFSLREKTLPDMFLAVAAPKRSQGP